MLGRDVDGFVAAYREYFDAHAPRAKERKTMLDPAPRMVLDPRFGLASLGRTREGRAHRRRPLRAHDGRHPARRGARRYEALPAQDIFDVEYWDLEQAKLKKAGKRRSSPARSRW